MSSRRSVVSIKQEDLDAVNDNNEEDEVEAGQNFTYIPPNPRKFYRRLLEHCLDTDLKAMRDPNVNDDDQVSLGILSPAHIEVINECALRWRISQPYRTACFLDLIKQLYERNEVPLDCVPEALGTVSKVLHEISLDKWPTQDVSQLCVSYLVRLSNSYQAEFLVSTHGSLFSIFLAAIYHAMDAIPTLKQAEVMPFVAILEQIKGSGLLDRFDVDIIARIDDIKDRVRIVAAEKYDLKFKELQAAPGVNRALPMLLMTDELENGAKTLDKRFPTPILE